MSCLRRPHLLIVALLGLAASLNSHAKETSEHDGIKVVVNGDLAVANMTKKQVMALFLGRTRTFPNGLVARVYDQHVGSSARKLFFETLTGKAIADIDAYWARLRYSGRAVPPKKMPSREALIVQLQQHDNALGYVVGLSSLELESKGLKVLLVLEP